MAVYNIWTDKMSIDQLCHDIKEIFSEIPEVTVSDKGNLSSGGSGFTVSFDDGHSAVIAQASGYCGVTVNGKMVTMGNSSSSTQFKYYAKPNGEVLVTTTDSVTSCVQWCIGKTDEGDWGAVALGCNTSSGNYDLLISTGIDASNTTSRYVTNYNSTNSNYIAIRRLVKLGDIAFENIFINTEGAPSPYSRIELCAEQYATGSNATGNNDMLLLKL